MKTRTDLLNFLAEKYNLQRYLEIGVQVPELNFDRIKCPHKVGVDPDMNARATHQMSSDVFFKTHGYHERFDLIFIDGLHTAEQVKKDFINASMCLSEKGFIVLHDCSPETYERTLVPRPTPTGSWNGDVYKFAIQLTDKYTVGIDNGCLVWRSVYGYVFNDKEYDWQYFDTHRKELLNLISWDEFVAIGSHV